MLSSAKVDYVRCSEKSIDTEGYEKRMYAGQEIVIKLFEE